MFEKPQYAIPLFLLNLLYFKSDRIFSKTVAEQAAAWSLPLASIATEIARSYYLQLRDDTELERAQREHRLSEQQKAIQFHCVQGKKDYDNQKFFDASLQYAQARQAFFTVYERERPGAIRQFAEICYLEAMPLFELHDFKNVIILLKDLPSNLASADPLQNTILNLLGLAYMKVGDRENAKRYFGESLRNEPNQLSLRLIYQFINGKYDEMLTHFPYKISHGYLPYPIPSQDQDPITVSSLLQNYAICFKEKANIKIAISLIEIAIQRLPVLPSYSLERVILLKFCSELYLEAGQQLQRSKAALSMPTSPGAVIPKCLTDEKNQAVIGAHIPYLFDVGVALENEDNLYDAFSQVMVDQLNKTNFRVQTVKIACGAYLNANKDTPIVKTLFPEQRLLDAISKILLSQDQSEQLAELQKEPLNISTTTFARLLATVFKVRLHVVEILDDPGEPSCLHHLVTGEKIETIAALPIEDYNQNNLIHLLKIGTYYFPLLKKHFELQMIEELQADADQSKLLTHNELIALSRDKCRRGLDVINDLKSTPLPSIDGTSVFGVKLAEVLELERYFKRQLNMADEVVQETYQIVLTSKKTVMIPSNVGFFHRSATNLTVTWQKVPAPLRGMAKLAAFSGLCYFGLKTAEKYLPEYAKDVGANVTPIKKG